MTLPAGGLMAFGGRDDASGPFDGEVGEAPYDPDADLGPGAGGPADEEGSTEDDSAGGPSLEDEATGDGPIDEGAADEGEQAQALEPRSVSDAVLAQHVVEGLDPAQTQVNLFNYDTGNRAPEGSSKAGSDTLSSTGSESAQYNYDTWLADNGNNINYGHLLTFGDGMRWLGYWNQGLVQAYGAFASQNPGVRHIVEDQLSDGSPLINSAAASDLITTGYDGDPLLYQQARNDEGALIYDRAGGRNIAEEVQQRAATAGGAGAPGELTEEELSLAYLFDPDAPHQGKQSYTDVTGLFQVDDEGYFYYNMHENFAQFTPDAVGDSAGHFTLYDAPACLRTDGRSAVGSFSPFNKASEVFTGVSPQGKLESEVTTSNEQSVNQGVMIDHHLGMTIETDFRQPSGGMVSASSPMTFEFAGDDDVWVFIDDVLVLDLGGIHSQLFGSIDFSTGKVYRGPAFGENGIPDDPASLAVPDYTTTIKERFEEAGRAEGTTWHGDTFSSNTSHTLKMFYLERGNYDSSLAVKFNLQPELYQQIKKVDQDGEPLANASFGLYAARMLPGIGASAADATLDQVEVDAAPLVTLTTDEEGLARFLEPAASSDGRDDGGKLSSTLPFNFADRYDAATGEGVLYVLRESQAPPGYRTLPSDLLLRYEPESTMLVVNNRYTTGAYASFVSYVAGAGQATYGSFDPATDAVQPSSEAVSRSSQRDGLVVAVPMLQSASDDSRWLALHGSNLEGYEGVSQDGFPSAAGDPALPMRSATLAAALYQCADDSEEVPHWFLPYNDQHKRLEGTLSDLPGRADRYRFLNPEGDMRMTYAVIEPGALAALGIVGGTAQERYDALGALVRSRAAVQSLDEAVQGLVAEIAAVDAGPFHRGFSMMNVDQFSRTFRSLIYIPNDRRELRVRKVDQDGDPVNGARFGLYASLGAAQSGASPLSSGVTATVDGQEGSLVFAPDPERAEDGSVLSGYVETYWPNAEFDDPDAISTYYLKEIAPPAGYEANPSIIPVKIGVYSIYADAGVKGDGVEVMAGVGKLSQTMTKFASNGDVNVTLRDITAIEQTQPSGAFKLDGWQDAYLEDTEGAGAVPRSMSLHYQQNALIDYGLHDADGGETTWPYFISDVGFVRTRVQQDLDAHSQPADPFYSQAARDDLGDTDLTGLFSLVNTVVVTDFDPQLPEAGELTLGKQVTGEAATAADYLRPFEFQVDLLDAAGDPLEGRFYFYGDRAGWLTSGGTVLLHHDESITVEGLPLGSWWRASELDAGQGGFTVEPAEGRHEGIVEGEAAEALFVNERQPDPVVPGEPDGPDDPDDPDDPGSGEEPGGEGHGSGLALTGDAAGRLLMLASVACLAAGAALRSSAGRMLAQAAGHARRPSRRCR